MICKMAKKALIGTALTGAGLYLAFGAHAPSYIRTAKQKIQASAKGAVPIAFEIDRARNEISALEPAIRDNMEKLARAQEDVQALDAELAASHANLDKQGADIRTLRASLDNNETLRTRGVSYTQEEVKAALKDRLDAFNRCERIVKEKESTLRSKQKAVLAAQEQLGQMAQQRQVLLSQVESIEARLAAIEATKTYNEFNFDDSALARAKQSVSELEKRLNVETRVAEMEGRFAEQGTPVIVEPARDVVKEVDAKFGTPAKGGEVGHGKSL